MSIRSGDLVERLRGMYRISVDDGAGPLNGSTEYVRQFETPPIQHEAADVIESLRAELSAANVRIGRLERACQAKNAGLKSAEASLLTITLGASGVIDELRGEALCAFITRNMPDITGALDRAMPDPGDALAKAEG